MVKKPRKIIKRVNTTNLKMECQMQERIFASRLTENEFMHGKRKISHKFFENKYKNYESIFYLSIDFIHTPSGILQLITDLKTLDPNIIIIHQIIKSIEYYISSFSDLQYVYLSLDGIPTISKIMEQRHRRYIGEIINNQISKKINNYDFPSELSEEYPYDYIKYHNTKFTFLKLNISPGTTFMKKLTKSIKNHIFPVNLQINDDTISGEGEYKIINYIRTYANLFINK